MKDPALIILCGLIGYLIYAIITVHIIENSNKKQMEEKIITLKESALKEVYFKASTQEKSLLERLYPDVQLKPKDFTSLKTFEDVCNELGYSTQFKYEAGTAYRKVVEAINKLTISDVDTYSKYWIYKQGQNLLVSCTSKDTAYIPNKYLFLSRVAAVHAAQYFSKEFKDWIVS